MVHEACFGRQIKIQSAVGRPVPPFEFCAPSDIIHLIPVFKLVAHEIVVKARVFTLVGIVSLPGVVACRIAERIDDEMYSAFVGIVEDAVKIADDGQRSGHFVSVDPGADEHESVVWSGAARDDTVKIESATGMLEVVPFDLDIASSGRQLLQFFHVAGGFPKQFITGAPFNDDHPPDDQLVFGSEVIAGKVEPQPHKRRQLHRPPMTQARIFKVDILPVDAADDRIVSAFEGEPVDDDWYLFAADPLPDIFQI